MTVDLYSNRHQRTTTRAAKIDVRRMAQNNLKLFWWQILRSKKASYITGGKSYVRKKRN